MNRLLKYWVMAALTCGLSMSVTSCKDDKNEPSEEEKQQQAEEQADKDMADAATFWSVVGQLTDTPMPDDWKNATYEPAIGQPDGTNTAVRIISAADEESAAERFANLVGANITAETQTYTYQNDLVGTLTYHKTGGTSLATVDVTIPKMPGLSQIVYKSPEQIGDNSSFKGTAYYRFGDVVQKRNADGRWDYWICVRPCFGPDGKTDSHWMTLSRLPEVNVKGATKTVNGVKLEHILPKSLGTSKDHMQNLAELLFAMTNSTEWATNLNTNNGYKTLKFFKDFNYQKNYKYHNEWFFKKVAEGWKNYEHGDLFKAMFGLPKDSLGNELKQWGMHLIHGTATMSGNDITLDMAEYNGTNLKTQRTYKATSRWDKTVFNIHDLMKDHCISNATLTANRGKIWVVRYASGSTLAKGSDEKPTFDKFKKLPNCEDVFVYNRDVDHLDMTEQTLKATDPKIAGEHGNQKGYYQLGDIIKYNNRYYVCASNHDINGTARFITLNDQDSHTTKTFPWKHDFGMTTEDVVYNDDMASAETATLWLSNIIFSKDRCDQVRNTMQAQNLSQYINQLVPETEEIRGQFLDFTKDGDQFITNVNFPSLVLGVSDYHIAQFKWEDLHVDDDLEYYNLLLTAPCGYLLVDKLHYATYLIGPTDHWVPYLAMMNDDDFNRLRTYLEAHNDVEKQTVSGTFEWQDMGIYDAEWDGKDSKNNTKHVKQAFHIVKVAQYWWHTCSTTNSIGEAAFVLDYTRDALNHPLADTRREYSKVPGSWIPRCITSREVTFLDEGKRQTKYQSIYVKSEE